MDLKQEYLLWIVLVMDCRKLGLDPPPARDANRIPVLIPGRRADQQYQDFRPGRASGQ